MELVKRVLQTRGHATGKVDLREVPRDDHLRAHAEAREEHLHLLRCGVLRFVEDDDGITQRATTHEGQWGDLDDARIHEVLELGGGDEFAEGVIERLEVGVELVLHLAREEAELLACFDGRAGEDDTAYLLCLEGFDRKTDGDEGLPRAGSTRGEAQVTLGELASHTALTLPAGEDRLAVDAVDEYVALGGGQGVGDLTAVPTHDLDDLCFGQLVVATA